MNGHSKVTSPWRIAIVGGGPSGLATARILQVNGISSTVYEAEESETARWSGGTLDLRPKTGRRAIREAHLDAEFEKYARPEGDELYILDHKANVLLSHKSDEEHPDQAAPEINRGDLRSILLGGLDKDTVVWGHKLLNAVEKKGAEGQVEYELEFKNGNKVVADLVIAADGTFSKTRTCLIDPSKPRYTGVTLVQVMISPDAKIPETEKFPGIENIVGQGLGLASDCGKHLAFQRESGDVIRLYASQFLPQDAKLSEDIQEVKKQLLEDFKGWDQKFLNFITKADETKPTAWRLYASDPEEKREVKLGVQLIGDANKHMTPFAGEGANTALADATDLALTLVSAISTLSPTATLVEKSQALLKAQQDFADIQFPRARKAALKSASGFDMTFNHPAQVRADQMKSVLGQ